MKKGNVLVIGNSGVGKSTLINAVFDEQMAKTNWGISGGTAKLQIYEDDDTPFQIIDSVGFEPSLIKTHKAIGAIKKWSKECTKKGNENTQINVVWFCVDGAARKLFPDTVKYFAKAISIFKSVPVIAVITKSFSESDKCENIQMVQDAFATLKPGAVNLKKIIPVVAAPYILNDNSAIPPQGIEELIDATNELMPEGLQAGEKVLSNLKLNSKRLLAQTIIATSTTAGTVVGAIPIPFADAAILTPLEIAEITLLSQVYGIKNDEKAKQVFNTIVDVGTVGVAAKMVISGIKAIPGINIASSVLNGIIAGSFVMAIGEGSTAVFEQIYLGNKSLDDIDWITKVIESKFASELIEKVKSIAESVTDKTDSKSIGEVITKKPKKVKKAAK